MTRVLQAILVSKITRGVPEMSACCLHNRDRRAPSVHTAQEYGNDKRPESVVGRPTHTLQFYA
jgi:hypothetical protein